MGRIRGLMGASLHEVSCSGARACACVQGSWRTAGALWIAMEFCGGGSVADLVHAAGDAPLGEDAIAYLCAETLAGLRYLHAIGKVPCPARSTRSSVRRSQCCEVGLSPLALSAAAGAMSPDTLAVCQVAAQPTAVSSQGTCWGLAHLVAHNPPSMRIAGGAVCSTARHSGWVNQSQVNQSRFPTRPPTRPRPCAPRAGAPGHQVREHPADGGGAGQAGGLRGGRAADAHDDQAQHLHRHAALDGARGHPGVPLRRQGDPSLFWLIDSHDDQALRRQGGNLVPVSSFKDTSRNACPILMKG